MSFEKLYRCSACREMLGKELFYVCSGRSTGISSCCKPCSIEKSRKWNLENKERSDASCEKYRKNNPQILKNWHERNPGYAKNYLKDWLKKNPEKVKANSKRARDRDREKIYVLNGSRRAFAKQATPAWANKWFMAQAHELAKLRTKITGFKWHVDHIVPLKGKTVCGLHVESNLQVIPASLNLKKGHRYWPDMP